METQSSGTLFYRSFILHLSTLKLDIFSYEILKNTSLWHLCDICRVSRDSLLLRYNHIGKICLLRVFKLLASVVSFYELPRIFILLNNKYFVTLSRTYLLTIINLKNSAIRGENWCRQIVSSTDGTHIFVSLVCFVLTIFQRWNSWFAK